MKKVRWIIQDSNFAQKDCLQIVATCKQLNIPCIQIPVIPFAGHLPAFPDDGFPGDITKGRGGKEIL